MGKILSIIVCVLLVMIGSSVYVDTKLYQILEAQTTNRFTVSDSSDPPTIEGYPISENDTVTGLEIDAIYTGQTEKVFSFEAAVNDSDGVDSVIFRFDTSGNWLNQTGIRTSGTAIDGIYFGSITFNIVWDSVKQLPEPRSIEFSVKVFANDTLGNWVETIPIPYSYFYWYIQTTTGSALTNLPINDALLVMSISCIAAAVIIGIYMKRKQVSSV